MITIPLALIALAEGAGLISLLIWLLVLCVVIYLLFFILGHLALPEPIRTVIVVVVALILLLFLVNRLGFL
jgi:hypothetical protein